MAGRSIGTLTLDLIAKTSSFEQGMGRAQRKVGDMDRDLQRMVARADKAALALATFAAGAAAGLVALTARTARAMDATSKMADQIGTTTEALTGLRFAAQQFSNVSDQQFDMALRRMTRRIEEAAQGSGGAKAAFDAMGLSARELSRLSADEQFMRIADAMQKTDTQAQRLKNTMAIFDTEGMPLVTALAQGSEELERNIELATRYGVVLSTQAAKSAEQFSTNLSRLGQIQEGYRQQLTTALLPALEKASGYMLGVAESALEVGNSRDRLQYFSDAAVQMVDDIARSYAGLLEIGRGVMDMLEALDQAALGWLEPFKQETQSAASILSQSFSESILNTAREIDKLVGFAGGVRAAWEAASGSIPGFFRQAWNNVLIGAAEFVNNLAELVNPMLETLGMDGFSRVSWGENIISGQRSITEAFREGYEAAKEASGMAARVQAAYDNVGESAASAAASIAGTNGAGGGGRNLTGSTKAAQKASEDFRKEQQRALQSQYQSISALHDQAQAMEDQVAVYGLGRTAIEDLTIARLEEQRVMLDSLYGDKANLAVEAIEREIEARKRLRTAIGSLEQKEAERAAWDEWARDVEQIFQQVGQSLTDALFEGGKSARDLIKDLFKTLTLRVLIQPIMGSIQGMVTNQLGGMLGLSNPGGNVLGMAQNASSLYGAVSGGLTGNVSNAIGWVGEKIGSTALQTFAAGMVGGMPTAIGAGLGASLGTTIGTSAASMATTTFSASLGGAAAGGSAAAGGAAGLGAAFGAALPWIGGALAVGSMFGLFGDDTPKTRHGQRARVDFAGDIFDITSTDDRQPGAESSVQQLVKQAVQSANAVFKQAGIDAAIDTFYAMTESSVLGDRQGVASGGLLRIGDALRQIGIRDSSDMTFAGFGGWSEADMLPRLQTDIQLSILQAFQSVGDQLPRVLADMVAGVDIRGLDEAGAQDLANRFNLVIESVSTFLAAIETMPFEYLRDVTFDAAANMIEFAGGLENLTSAQQTYFENFYSEAEQHEHAINSIGRALSDVGVQMPAITGSVESMLGSYRALVEAQDLTTEAGQRAYVALMQVSGAFAEVASNAGRIASEASEHERLVRAAQAQYQQAANRLQAAYSAVQRNAQAAIDQLQQTFSVTDSIMGQYRTQVRQLETDLSGLLNTISRSIADLRGQTEATSRAQYQQARAVISTALLTGQLPQTADLNEAIRIAQQGVMGGRYASAFDQRAAYVGLANELEALRAIAKPELDTALESLKQLEKQYNALRGISDTGESSLATLQRQLESALETEANAREQIAAIERQLGWAESQYNALLKIDNSIGSLAQAMEAMRAADQAMREAINNPISRDQAYLESKLAQLQRTGSMDAGIDWTQATTSDLAAVLRSVNLTPEEHYKRYGRYEGLSYDVGTSYVPRDMLANVHRGEIIIDPRSSDILRRYGIGVQGGGNSVAIERKLDELISETRQSNRYQYELVKSGKRTQNYTEDTARALQSESDDVVLVM